jgi:NADPH2:quinone reductase
MNPSTQSSDETFTEPTQPSDQTLTEVVLPGRVDPNGLVVRQRPLPSPGRGQALVEMLATGVSFAEQLMRRGRYPNQPAFPFVPGYDLVGVVTGVGSHDDASWIGSRVAAVVKTGGWTTHALVDARDLMPVPDGIGSAEAEAVLLDGIAAWQMLQRKAKVRFGQTILVHGANGGIGNTLVQLARHDGVRVIGTASPRHHHALREMGSEPLDYNDPYLAEQVRALAPEGVDAIFDHLGGPSFKRSFGLLGKGGTLVAYGTAAQRDETNNVLLTFLGLYGRLELWSLLPNGRRALFYNFWAGKTIRAAAFRQRLAADLTSVLSLAAQGAIIPQVAARIPISEAGRAMTLAESKTTYGKVVLVP